MKARIALVIMAFSLIAIVPDAWGVTLNAFIHPWEDEGVFTVSYLQTFTITHDREGQLADALAGQEWRIERQFGPTDDGVQNLAAMMNSIILKERSQVTLSDLEINYSASLSERSKSSDLDFKIIITGNLNDYIITNEDALNPGIIDMGWRHFDIEGPVIIDGININNPASILEENSPDVYEMIRGTEAINVLDEPLLREDALGDLLGVWHFLFDPTGINVDAGQFGLSDSIIDQAISKYTLGESSIREGRKTDEVVNIPFSLDKEYFMRTIHTIDIGAIAIVGYTSISSLDDLETLGFSQEPIGTTTSTGGFPAHIVIGMSVMAAIGGIAFFIISNRQLKREKGMGQTGIDPARLQATATSEAAGGYQTNRGEAQLRDNYDSGSSSSPEIPKEPSRGAMPKGWDK